jgi:hypothetical protein
MSDPSFEQQVLQKLDTLYKQWEDHGVIDVGEFHGIHTKVDMLLDNQKTFGAKFDEHVKENSTRFEAIDHKFTAIAVIAAEDKGSAKATAKTWGIVGGAGSAIIGGLATFLKYFGHHAAK